MIEYCMSDAVVITLQDQEFYASRFYRCPANTFEVDPEWGWRIRLAAHLCTQSFDFADLGMGQLLFDTAFDRYQ